MTTTETPVESAAGETFDERWELLAQFRRAARTFRLIASIVLIIGALLVLSEAIRFYELFARIHAVGGYLYLMVLFAALYFLVGVPAWRYWRVPSVLRPPDVHFQDGNVKHLDLVKRTRYLDRYCRALQHNPELAAKTEQTADVSRRARALHQRAKATTANPAMASFVDEIRDFEKNAINPLLVELDAKVEAYIRSEALAVGVSTAVCTSGTLDAFFVLWRAVNMVSRISRLYYGRPGLQGTIVLLGDVGGAVVLSRAADSVTDFVGDLAAESPGLLRAVPGMSILAGPVLDGSINALMMLRIGYLARRRCRSFEAWDKKAMRAAVTDVLHSVAQEAASFSMELATRIKDQVMPFMSGALKTATVAAGAGFGTVVDVAGAGADVVRGGGLAAWQFVQNFWGRGSEEPEQ